MEHLSASHPTSSTEGIFLLKASPPSQAEKPASSLAAYSARVLDLIFTDELSEEQAEMIMKETVENWSEHINPAFLKYRKSVAESDGFAAIEWRDGTPGGSTLLDARGNVYIDFLAGFGVFNVGRSNPSVLAAVQKQLAKQPMHSQELLDPLRCYCANLLTQSLPGNGKLKYAFFTNSGAESVEHCLKFAMLSTGRKHYVGLLGAFHGKTMGAVSATSKSIFRKAFGGGLLSFSHVPVNDLDALRRVFEASRFTGNEIAGLIIEPVLGEGGIHVCTDDFLRLARSLCDEYGSRLIFDEVQSGMGRTGKWWACEHAGVVPDLVAVGKAFGGGVVATGAVVGTEEVWEKYFENPFLFTTTFGGSPGAMAAAIATIHEIETKGLVQAAGVKGDYLLSRLRSLKRRFPSILRDVRGRGLMIGLEFPNDEVGYAFSRGVFRRKVLLAGTLINSRVIRVEPPLTITQEEMDAVLSRFEETMLDMEEKGIGVPVAEFTPNDVPVHSAAPSTAAAAAASASVAAPASASTAIEGISKADIVSKVPACIAPASSISAPISSAAAAPAAFVGVDVGQRDRNDSVASSDTEISHGTASIASGESSSCGAFEDRESEDEALPGTVAVAAAARTASVSDDEEDPRHVNIKRRILPAGTVAPK